MIEYLGRNIKDLFKSKRRLIIEEAYKILYNYRILRSGERCDIACCEFNLAYNKVCREFCGNYYNSRKMSSLKSKPTVPSRLLNRK